MKNSEEKASKSTEIIPQTPAGSLFSLQHIIRQWRNTINPWQKNMEKQAIRKYKNITKNWPNTMKPLLTNMPGQRRAMNQWPRLKNNGGGEAVAVISPITLRPRT